MELNKLKPTEVSRNSAKRAWWQCHDAVILGV
ncbi:MAG: zinc-ribbon domain-containing protein [Dorea sp.]